MLFFIGLIGERNRGSQLRLHNPTLVKEAWSPILPRKERMLIWSAYAWIMAQNGALITFLKYLEYKDTAWFEVSSSMIAALVYRISLFFAGLG
jgi:hypothetical protein